MKILSIDPGGTTGLAVRGENNKIATCVVKTPEEVYAFIRVGIDYVVCENFKAEVISKYGLHTVKIVGGAYALAYVQNIHFVLHEPQDRYPFKSDAKELLETRKKELKQSYMVHELDALAHLLRFEYDYAKQQRRTNTQ